MLHFTMPMFAFLQVPTYMMSDGQFKTLLVFTGLIALWLFLLSIALIAVAIMVVKLLKTVNEFTTRIESKALAITDRFESKLYPVLDNVKDLVNDSVPKIKRITDNIADTTDVYRSKVAQVDALITDTTSKVKHQSDRIDGMVSHTLTSAGNLVGRVEDAIFYPVRHLTALFSGLRASAARLVEEYSQPSAPKAPKPVAFEGESIYTGLEDDYHA